MRFDETLMTCVRKDLSAGNIVMLLGEPGIGKSSWTENLAHLMRTKCFTLACNQLADKADLTGARLMPYTDPDGNESYKQCFFPHAVVMDAVDYANTHKRETPILFLDELNRTNADVTSELLSIPTMRRLGDVSLPDNLIVLCAGNDKGNVTSLDEASISRFVLYRVQPDVATFLSLDDELNPFVKTVLERHPETLFCKQLPPDYAGDDDDDPGVSIDEILGSDDGMAQLTTPRTVSKLSKWLNLHDRDELLALLANTYDVDGEEISALQEQVEGHVGRTAFSAYLLAEISDSVSRGDVQTSAATQVARPDAFDALESAMTVDAINDAVSDMTDADRSGCLLWAIYDKADHANAIRALAPQTRILGDDMQVLMRLSSYGKLDDENLGAFLAVDCPLTQQIGQVLDMMR